MRWMNWKTIKKKRNKKQWIAFTCQSTVKTDRQFGVRRLWHLSENEERSVYTKNDGKSHFRKVKTRVVNYVILVAFECKCCDAPHGMPRNVFRVRKALDGAYEFCCLKRTWLRMLEGPHLAISHQFIEIKLLRWQLERKQSGLDHSAIVSDAKTNVHWSKMISATFQIRFQIGSLGVQSSHSVSQRSSCTTISVMAFNWHVTQVDFHQLRQHPGRFCFSFWKSAWFSANQWWAETSIRFGFPLSSCPALTAISATDNQSIKFGMWLIN